jgi:ribonuclease HI/exonuclease III
LVVLKDLRVNARSEEEECLAFDDRPLPGSKQHKRAACRLNTYIPHPRITFYNINSLSAHPLDKEGRHRKSRVLKHIAELLKACDILCLQETHLGPEDSITLTTHFKSHLVFLNNLDIGRAGTAILVSKDFASGYDISSINMGEIAKGRVQALRFASVIFPHKARASFNMANVYLSAGNKQKIREQELASLGRLDTSGHTFMCGDFNFTDRVADSPSPTSYLTIKGAELIAWESMLDSLGLREVPQDTHTHFFIASTADGCRTSRIDRIYSSLRDAELLVVTPSAYIPVVSGYSPKSEFARISRRDGPKACAFKARFVSDHLPVALTFTQNTPTKKRAFNIPKWIADTEGFAEKVSAHWYRGGETPYEINKAWKEAVGKATKDIFKELKDGKKKVQGDLAFLSSAIAVIRACSARSQDKDYIESMLSKSSELRGLTLVNIMGEYECRDLETKVEKLFATELGKVGADWDGEDALPGLYLPGDRRGEDPIKAIKRQLPCTRGRLTHLKGKEEDILTDDPQAMGDIIALYYSEVWKFNDKGAGDGEVWEYLDKYDVRVPTHLQPSRPTPDDFADAITSSNDSAAGPDGIPFNVYRKFLQHDPDFAKTLCDVTTAMCDGIPPPKAYNHARLFLIPKRTGGLVSDTRCISVTNSENRLNASVVASLITPALQEVIHEDQGGFVPGRVGTLHVHNLTGGFYEALSKKQQMYVMLLDTARAFDTLAHNFINLCLLRMGWAAWVCTMVGALLTQVWVIPVLACATAHRIHIQRGVKQGCPLSPLLFILCFNVLLCYLSSVRGLRKFGYADDLALLIRSVTRLLAALVILARFAAVSDLLPNQKKTTIIPALPPSSRTRKRLADAGWGNVEFKSSGVYLGVLFGPKVSTVEICQGAWDKFVERVELYKYILRSTSINTRVLIFNTFLLPLFYYLAQFIILPYQQVVAPVREICRKYIIPFNGGGFGYAHLITPRGGGFALARPLKDLWAINMTFLASPFELENSHRAPTPELGSFSGVAAYGGLDNSVRTADHMAYCAFALLEDYAPRTHGLLDLTKLPEPHKAALRRKWIYDNLAGNGYKAERELKKCATSLQVKVGKAVGCAPCKTLAGHLVAHAKLASSACSASSWNCQIRLTFNSLPFDRRRLQAKMAVTDRSKEGGGSTIPCWVCGSGEDSMQHVFGDCTVVNNAKDSFADKVGCALGKGMAAAVLAFPPDKAQLATLATVSFNHAVWHTRTHFLCTLSSTLEPSQAIARLVSTALHGMPVDRNKGREMVIRELAWAPPPWDVAGYTDGSALGNPGPCGGGFVIIIGGTVKEEHWIPLGWGDNNKGEMAALLAIFERLESNFEKEDWPSGARCLIFSDSAGCIGFLERGWKSPTEVKLSRDTRAALARLRKKVKVLLYWIRGHVDIPGNELADKQARKGADAAKQDIEGNSDQRRAPARKRNREGEAAPPPPGAPRKATLPPLHGAPQGSREGGNAGREAARKREEAKGLLEI